MKQVLEPAEMGEADWRTIAGGVSGIELMRRAGAAIAVAVERHLFSGRFIHVLCGPGNNGGDGYVVAQLLAKAGHDVTVWASAPPRPGSDAALAARDYEGPVRRLADLDLEQGALAIDALFGAGLDRPLGDAERTAFAKVRGAQALVVAVDLPSGVSGRSGAVLGDALRADLTVTFARRKPGHLLLPGKALCGDVVVADIGIPDAVIAGLGVRCFENEPGLWQAHWPRLEPDTHKYRRGHVGVFSAGLSATGAARLSALAAARAGAGAVTLLSPSEALAANAAHLTSIILRQSDTLADARAFLDARKPDALVYGPGQGPDATTGRFARELLTAAAGLVRHVVLDADALTASAGDPEALFAARKTADAPGLVLTPHEGEFGRLFPDIAGRAVLSKLDKARAAAARADAVIVYKGSDTVVATPDGRASIATNATPLLATAGSGDVLSGIVASLLAQKMPAFEAASAAVWLHAEAAREFGPGLIAEDLPGALPAVLRRLETPAA